MEDDFRSARAPMTRAALLLTILLVAVTANGQRATARQSARVRAEMLVSTKWLAGRLTDPQVVVLHVARERAHYDRGHIPGARFVPWNELTSMRGSVPNELPPVADLQKLFGRLGIGDRARLIIYGDNSGLSAARAYFTLDYLGHGERAALLDGGLERWQAEKRPVSTTVPEVAPLTFTPRVRADVVVDFNLMRDLSWVRTHVDGADLTLLDARPPEEYRGTKSGDAVPRAGHIPGAENIYWMQHLVSREDPVMRPAGELRRLYEEAGAAPGRFVVTYCRTGAQSSHAYFTAKYLGYRVMMYDGSFFEWSRVPEAPVETGGGRR